MWVRAAGGIQHDRALSVSAIPAGGCYISGFITDTVIVGNDTLDGGFAGHAFIAKYDATGTLQWIRVASGIYDSYARSVTTMPDGGCAVTGYFRQSATFGTTLIQHSGTFSGGESDVFIVRYDGQGNLLWVKGAGGYSAYCNGNSIGCDLNGNIYLTGSFSQTATFDHLSLTATASLAGLGGEDDLFVAKYNSSGLVQWVKKAGGGGDPDFIQSADVGHSIVVTADGVCYVSGTIYGAVQFDAINLQSAGNRDGFVAKYNSDGTAGWAKLIGGPGEDQARGVSIDTGSHIYVCGEFTQSFNAGGTTLVSQGLLDGFVASFTPAGNISWAKSTGGEQGEYCAAVNASHNTILLTGSYNSPSVNFGSTSLTLTDESADGYSDVFFAKISEDNIPTGIEHPEHSALSLQLYPNPCKDNLYLRPSQNGSYTLTITDLSGRIVFNTLAEAGPERAIKVPLQFPSGNYLYNLSRGERKVSGLFTKE